METLIYKSCEEIDALKENWRRDPCWDIYSTEGFEAHKEELKAFQDQCEKEWKEERERNLSERATKLGIPDRLDLVRYFESLEYRLNELEQRVSRLEDRN